MPELKGRINQFNYVANKITFVLEVPPGIDGAQSGKERIKPALHVVQSTPWDKVFAVGLLTTTAVIVIATLIEDYLTLGTGVADDPASFALAAGMSARGAVLWGTANAVVQRALVSATVRFSLAIVPAAALKYDH